MKLTLNLSQKRVLKAEITFFGQTNLSRWVDLKGRVRKAKGRLNTKC